jgi:putative transposase
MKTCKLVYNKALDYLNLNQEFSKLGKAKGTKAQQFQTLSMRTWIKELKINIPAKLIHSTLQRAYSAWSNTKPDLNKLKLAKRYEDKFFTLDTCPTALSKGKLYLKFWGDNEPLTFRYNHKDVSLLNGNCLLFYIQYGRLYCAQPNIIEAKEHNNSNKVIALDPGIRNFITAFDGYNAYQFTNGEDLARIAKIKAYRAKLHKQLKGKSLELKRKIKYKMSCLNRKAINLVKDLHRKVASWLASNNRIIFVPSYKIKQIYKKGKQNKTNRKNQLNYSWFKFVETLKYHCAVKGSVVIEVSEAYTSKTCSNCGHIHYKLGSNKTFNCPSCNHLLDRDLNGAINIYLNSLIIQGGLGY